MKNLLFCLVVFCVSLGSAQKIEVLPEEIPKDKFYYNAEGAAKYELWRLNLKLNKGKKPLYLSDFLLKRTAFKMEKATIWEYSWTLKEEKDHNLPSNTIYIYVSNATPSITLYWERWTFINNFEKGDIKTE